MERLARAVDRIAVATNGRTPSGVAHEQAHPVDGSILTDSAIGFDPFPLLQAFSQHHADVVVMGQVAGIMHGSAELTGDLDLLWDPADVPSASMAAAFNSVSAELTDVDGRPIPCTPQAFELAKVFFRSSSSAGDCCTPLLPWGSLDIAGIIRRASTARRGDLRVRYVAMADLIAMRDAVRRPKDLRRADELRRLTRVDPA